MIYLAEKTLKAIDEALEKDQGASFRMWLGRVIPHMKDAFRSDEEGFRGHLGASIIGKECAREVWYSFRWTTKGRFEGRMIRLFNRGHLEEARFIALLLMIGCQVYQQDEKGNQFRIADANGHFGGSGDGICINIPDLPPETAALCEFKTSNSKGFAQLVANGVREAKFEHYVQMNIYMRKMELPAALYLVVNKDNDEIYGELVAVDIELADQFISRADAIIKARTPPPRISASPGWYNCKFCAHHKVCHMKGMPDRNCRTCKYSEPGDNGIWHCKLKNVPLSKDAQFRGCDLYEVIKEM